MAVFHVLFAFLCAATVHAASPANLTTSQTLMSVQDDSSELLQAQLQPKEPICAIILGGISLFSHYHAAAAGGAAVGKGVAMANGGAAVSAHAAHAATHSAWYMAQHAMWTSSLASITDMACKVMVNRLWKLAAAVYEKIKDSGQTFTKANAECVLLKDLSETLLMEGVAAAADLTSEGVEAFYKKRAEEAAKGATNELTKKGAEEAGKQAKAYVNDGAALLLALVTCWLEGSKKLCAITAATAFADVMLQSSALKCVLSGASEASKTYFEEEEAEISSVGRISPLNWVRGAVTKGAAQMKTAYINNM